MSYGFAVFDASGNPTFQATDTFCRLLLSQVVTVPSGTATYVSVPGITPSDASWQVTTQQYYDYNNGYNDYFTSQYAGSFEIENDRVKFYQTTGSNKVYFMQVFRL